MKSGNWVLMVEATSELAIEGEVYSTRDGERYVLEGGAPPHKLSSTGFVYVRVEGAPNTPDYSMRYYAGVLGMKWLRSTGIAAKARQVCIADINEMTEDLLLDLLRESVDIEELRELVICKLLGDG